MPLPRGGSRLLDAAGPPTVRMCTSRAPSGLVSTAGWPSSAPVAAGRRMSDIDTGVGVAPGRRVGRLTARELVICVFTRIPTWLRPVLVANGAVAVGRPAVLHGLSVRLNRSPPRYGRFFAYYLLAQLQALVADDPPITSRCHGRDLVTVLPAEAALFCLGVITYLLDRGYGRAGRLAVPGYHHVRVAHTTVTDKHAGPGDQLRDLLLALPAERARQKVSGTEHSPTVPRLVRPSEIRTRDPLA